MRQTGATPAGVAAPSVSSTANAQQASPAPHAAGENGADASAKTRKPGDAYALKVTARHKFDLGSALVSGAIMQRLCASTPV